MILVGFDLETHLFKTGSVLPRIVCATFAMRDERGEIDTWGRSRSPSEKILLSDEIENMLDTQDVHFVGANIAYDFACVRNEWPNLTTKIFQAYEDGRIHDVLIREKLLVLSTTGDLEYMRVPGGGKQRLRFDLQALTGKYLGIDTSAEKNDDDSWRLNFDRLDGLLFDEYPEDAKTYALGDAGHPLEIWEVQETAAQTREQRSTLDTGTFRAYAAFSLQLMTARGIAIDPEEKGLLELRVADELVPEKLRKLVGAGILVPGQTARPAKRRANIELAAKTLGISVDAAAEKLDYTDAQVAALTAAGVTLTAPKAQKKSTTTLKAHVEKLCASLGIKPKMTDASNKNPEGQISCDADVMDRIAEKDPSGVLQEYVHYQSVQKLVSTELPRMNDPETGLTAECVHPNYDVLKETGRTSSFAGDKYASANIQNVDPRARACYVARPGHVLASIDFSAIELVSASQTQIDLFGHSTLGQIINEGIDPHAYLASQLAYYLHADFRASCDEAGLRTPREIFEAFSECKKSKNDEVVAFFKHWRKFAKPTGLGYPGGLGAETFITYARTTYGVEVSLETAKQLKEIWLATFPEFQEGFAFITRDCVDPDIVYIDEDDETAQPQPTYMYTTPLGMTRRGCFFCAAANGRFMQSPTAEGALNAVNKVTRACYDPSLNSPAYGAFPVAFIHDEVLVEIPENEKKHDRAFAIADVMVNGMRPIMRDVTVKANPALMRRWNKDAEGVFDADGKLQIWEPKQ